MGWRDWPSWLKGGIIIELTYIILTLWIIIYSLLCGDACRLAIITITLPSLYIINNIWGILIANLIFWFAIGALIGALISWIYGKIKNKKSK